MAASCRELPPPSSTSLRIDRAINVARLCARIRTIQHEGVGAELLAKRRRTVSVRTDSPSRYPGYLEAVTEPSSQIRS